MATDRLINSTQGDSIISELDNIADKIEGINRDIILPSNQINAMTGYSEPSGTSAITPSNTLNEAIGKLERKADNNTSNISTVQQHYICDNDRKLYISATEPTGDIPADSTWIDGKTIKTNSRTAQLYNQYGTDTTNGYDSSGYLDSDGSIVSSNTLETSEYIDITGDEQYTLYLGLYTVLNAPSVVFYDTNHTYISGIKYNSQNPVTFTAPSTATYCRISVSKAKKGEIMMNQGSTAAEYAPYYTWA